MRYDDSAFSMLQDVLITDDPHIIYFTFVIDRMDKTHEYSVYFPDQIARYNIMHSDAQLYQRHFRFPIYISNSKIYNFFTMSASDSHTQSRKQQV